VTHDVIVLGSSFTGALLAWILARQGMRVLVLDRGRHPRFAVGESSTPTADAALARIAARWDLPAVAPLSRYGSWRRAYPELGRGLKRGFSYFQHREGKPFAEGPAHDASLLVAASASDEESDTHWVRADVDAFFFRQAVAAGADCREDAVIDSLEGPGAGPRSAWSIRWREAAAGGAATAPRLVDATGGGGVLGAHLGLDSLGRLLTTRCGAIYSHVAGLGSWDRLRLDAGDGSTVAPFRSDDAAQHHLLADGWVWMLRFDDDRASVGIVTRHPAGGISAAPADARPLDARWAAALAGYPDVRRLLAGARLLRPLAAVPRLSRLWARASGPGWAMLPTTAGFVDPLHSTGIAHGLSGVERLAALLLAESHDEQAWLGYGRDVVDEVRWIDAIVGVCSAAIPDFELFRLASTWYFLAVVASERAAAAGIPLAAGGFLSAKNRALRGALTSGLATLGDLVGTDPSSPARGSGLASLHDLLAPLDTVGLLDPAAHNRIAHTAARKPVAAARP